MIHEIRNIGGESVNYWGGNLPEFAALVESTSSTSYAARYPKDSDFCPFTYAEALESLKKGWPEGRANLGAAISEIERSHRQDRKWDVEGHVFDVAELLAGEPEHWLNFQAPKDKPVVKIGLNIWSSWKWKPHHLINRGAAVYSLISKLIESDVFVDLYAYVEVSHDSSLKGKQATYAVTEVKIDTNPIDLDLLAFTSSHPGMLRRLWFRALEVMSGKDDVNPYGYMTNNIRASLEDEVFFTPDTSEDYDNPKAAMDAVNAAFAKWQKDRK